MSLSGYSFLPFAFIWFTTTPDAMSSSGLIRPLDFLSGYSFLPFAFIRFATAPEALSFAGLIRLLEFAFINFTTASRLRVMDPIATSGSCVEHKETHSTPGAY